jgi:hypothetical protein
MQTDHTASGVDLFSLGVMRVSGAPGTFTLLRIGTVDVATGIVSASGSFEGHINLNH